MLFTVFPPSHQLLSMGLESSWGPALGNTQQCCGCQMVPRHSANVSNQRRLPSCSLIHSVCALHIFCSCDSKLGVSLWPIDSCFAGKPRGSSFTTEPDAAGLSFSQLDFIFFFLHILLQLFFFFLAKTEETKNNASEAQLHFLLIPQHTQSFRHKRPSLTPCR